MRSQRQTEECATLVCRLQQDRHFAFDFVDAALRTGNANDVALAFSHLALAFDEVAISPESINPDEARVVLERMQVLLELGTRDIILS
jgi:hypothetical protein